MTGTGGRTAGGTTGTKTVATGGTTAATGMTGGADTESVGMTGMLMIVILPKLIRGNDLDMATKSQERKIVRRNHESGVKGKRRMRMMRRKMKMMRRRRKKKTMMPMKKMRMRKKKRSLPKRWQTANHRSWSTN